MQNSQSIADPRIVLGLTTATSIGLTPFALYHVFTGNWPLVFSVASLALWHGMCALYIWRHPNSHRAGPYVLYASMVAVLWGVHHLGSLGIHWSYVLILGIFYILPRRQAVIANFIATPMAIVLVAPHVQRLEFTRIVAGMTLVSVFSYVFSRSVELQRMELTRLVSIDPLTHARNRRALNDSLLEAVYRLQRHGTKTSLIILDIDHFKPVNDRFGHDVGDAVLVSLADRLRARLRLSDVLYRYGGEEFVVLATETELECAGQLAEELRRIVSAEPIPPLDRTTVSCGVAELRPGESGESWLKRADKALYLAKEQGRDRVVLDSAHA